MMQCSRVPAWKIPVEAAFYAKCHIVIMVLCRAAAVVLFGMASVATATILMTIFGSGDTFFLIEVLVTALIGIGFQIAIAALLWVGGPFLGWLIVPSVTMDEDVSSGAASEPPQG